MAMLREDGSQLQDTPHLGGTGGERPADVAPRLGVRDVRVPVPGKGVDGFISRLSCFPTATMSR
jgi:hypothetical protein